MRWRPSNGRTAALVLAVLSWIAAAAVTAFGQSPAANVSDEQRRFLEVRRRQVELSAAKADLERARQLFEQRPHFLRAERAVDGDREQRGVRDRDRKGLDRAARCPDGGDAALAIGGVVALVSAG